MGDAGDCGSLPAGGHRAPADAEGDGGGQQQCGIASNRDHRQSDRQDN
jgi:hypothetical protein